MNDIEITPPAPVPDSGGGTLLHPAAGAFVLALDWVLFSGTVVSVGTAMWPLALVGLTAGTLGATWIQRRFGRDSIRASLVKGAFCGIAVGLPFPIAGTAVGGWILAASGLDRLRRRRVTGP